MNCGFGTTDQCDPPLSFMDFAKVQIATTLSIGCADLRAWQLASWTPAPGTGAATAYPKIYLLHLRDPIAAQRTEFRRFLSFH